ncbi:hypothetical protein [Gynuella sp.]|uniref:hypothetical protein n=1 Tax=Gynuella sp. TaxID=2969146 RepID=UPI003D0C07B9
MNYKYPEELEFFDTGFGVYDENDPGEGLFSYIYIYEGDSEFVVTYSPSSKISFSAKLITKGIMVFNIYQEYVSKIAFQAWSDEKVIRIYCNTKSINTEFRLDYLPHPGIYVANT